MPRRTEAKKFDKNEKTRELWQAMFLHRKRKEGYLPVFDAASGCYPNDGILTNIILNLHAITDENGYIESIDYYKVYDSTQGFGRPSTEPKELNLQDIKVFSKILEECTISRTDKVLEPLLIKAKENGLPNGWSVQKWSKTTVTFIAPDGSVQKSKVSDLIDAIELSYTYYDILYNPYFWEKNLTIINNENKEPFLALFSLLDTKNYYKRDYLIEQAKIREKALETEHKYDKLCDACEQNRMPEAKKYADVVSENLADKLGRVPPLYSAVSNNNFTLVKLLLKNGASINEGFWSGFMRRANPLSAAIKSNNEQAYKLFIKQPLDAREHSCSVKAAIDSNKPDIALTLLKKGAYFFPDERILDYPIEFLVSVAKYPGIKWKPKHLDAVYKTGNTKAVKLMLKSLEIPKEEDYIGSKARVAAIVWIVKVKDLDLMRYCAKLNYQLVSYHFHEEWKLWYELKKLPEVWFKYFKQVFKDEHEFNCYAAGYNRRY